MHLQNQKVLITGGASGIGFELARLLLAAGNQVVVCGRNPARLAAAGKALPGLHTLQADISAPGQHEALLAGAAGLMGGISVLINNAAIQHSYSLITTDPATLPALLAEELAINFSGPVLLAAHAIPYLRRQPAAAILNITSGLAISPKRSSPIYCATKAALSSLTRSLRYQLELECPHVRACEALLPLVQTPMTQGRNETGIPAARAAEAILDGLRAGRPHHAIGKVRLLQWLHRFLPSLAYRLLRDH